MRFVCGCLYAHGSGRNALRLHSKWMRFGNIPDTDLQMLKFIGYTSLKPLLLVYRDKPVAGGAVTRAR